MPSGWGFCPQIPFMIRLSYSIVYLTRLPIYTFHFLTTGLSPLLLAKSWLSAEPGHDFWSFVLRYFVLLRVPVLKISNDVVVRDLWFAPPQ